MIMRIYLSIILALTCLFNISLAAEVPGNKTAVGPETEEIEKKTVDRPIVVNGDTVEYSSDNKEVTAKGKVDITYKDVKLSCDQITVNTLTKDGLAEGHVRIDEERGSVEGSKMLYNFNTKQGTVYNATFRFNPYYGRTRKVLKISDLEYVGLNGYFTTCSFDRPHYRIKSKKINIFPDDKIQTYKNIFFLHNAPLAYLSKYSQSLKEPLMHVQVVPGHGKKEGYFLLSAWRYQFSDNFSGRIYADYRQKWGNAQGFGANYNTQIFGKGDLKFYYTQQRDSSLSEKDYPVRKFERYFIRDRHYWNIDDRTNFISEYYKIVDSRRAIYGTDNNILKDYFPREYEKDTQPLSYALLHHNFNYSSVDVLMQKRTNRWYTQEEKLPEIKYSLPSRQIGESWVYFHDDSSFISYNNKNAVPSDSWNDTSYNKLSTTNRFSLPSRVFIFAFTPFISEQWALNDKGIYGNTYETMFSTGTDLSTKFYRVFDVNTNLWNLNINGLRHIITPTASYSYNHGSTMPTSKLRFGGGGDTSSSSIALELSNKLQTRRTKVDKKSAATVVKGEDIANFKINSNYLLKPESGVKRGSNFSDVIFDLELRPYSWLSLDADSTYYRSDRSSPNYNKLSIFNYDIGFNFGVERTIGFGQRFNRKGSNEFTSSAEWRLTPKWKFKVYERYQLYDSAPYERKAGLREQEYTISRDLHCWLFEFTYNVRVGEGATVWFVFKLKAFPEMAINFDQSYNKPKAGSQSY
ncbi:MAG: LPS export ABC transporter periplasmic protein LptC [Candidatus Omnitrophica bacterium]|nr:LPS export ABC transporter periplasmic protein LptC [Candidatus Omnitrophota bacterium]